MDALLREFTVYCVESKKMLCPKLECILKYSTEYYPIDECGHTTHCENNQYECHNIDDWEKMQTCISCSTTLCNHCANAENWNFLGNDENICDHCWNSNNIEDTPQEEEWNDILNIDEFQDALQEQYGEINIPF